MMVIVVLVESKTWLTRTGGASRLERSDIVLIPNTGRDEYGSKYEEWKMDETSHSPIIKKNYSISCHSPIAIDTLTRVYMESA